MIKSISISFLSLLACSSLAMAHCGKCEHKDGEAGKKEEAGEKKEEKKEEAKLIADGDCKGGKCGEKKGGEEADAPAVA